MKRWEMYLISFIPINLCVLSLLPYLPSNPEKANFVDQNYHLDSSSVLLNLKSFFIPTGNYNTSDFISSEQISGVRPDVMYEVYYFGNSDATSLIEASFIKGTVVSTDEKFINFYNSNEIKMTSEIFTNQSLSNHKAIKYNFEPPEIILQAPTTHEGIIYWSYKLGNGDIYNCKSSFTTLNVSGESKKTLKVEKTITYNGNSKSRKVIDYYVQNIGFYGEDVVGNDGKALPFEVFFGLSVGEVSY